MGGMGYNLRGPVRYIESQRGLLIHAALRIIDVGILSGQRDRRIRGGGMEVVDGLILLFVSDEGLGLIRFSRGLDMAVTLGGEKVFEMRSEH